MKRFLCVILSLIIALTAFSAAAFAAEPEAAAAEAKAGINFISGGKNTPDSNSPDSGLFDAISGALYEWFTLFALGVLGSFYPPMWIITVPSLIGALIYPLNMILDIFGLGIL